MKGPAKCEDPVIVFGGDGEDRIDPKDVEIIWPGYDDGYDNYGYVTINNFDPIPEIPEQSYGSFWYHSAVLVDKNLILSCGGGFPATKKCFGLDLVSGTWRSMAPMTVARNDHTLVNVNNGIIAIGGASPEEPLIEIYNRDFDIWTAMPQWTGPFSSISGHCAVAINDHQVMIIGYTFNTSIIFNLQTGEWSNTAPIPNPRYAHACVLTAIGGISGVLVTGGKDFHTDPSDYYPASQTDFYQIESNSWISLENTSFPVEEHQMVIYEGKPTIIGGEYELFLRDVEIDGRHMRDHVQIYQEESDHWFCCVPKLNYKRSKFSAVKVPL